MSNTLTTEDQLKFALSCFHNSSSGKIDWKSVATERGIISTGAAQKRWERLNKAHGFSTSGSSSAGGGTNPSTPLPKEKAKGKGKTAGRSGGSAAKKRKIQQLDEVEEEEDDVDEQEIMRARNMRSSEDDDGEAYIKDEEQV